MDSIQIDGPGFTANIHSNGNQTIHEANGHLEMGTGKIIYNDIEVWPKRAEGFTYTDVVAEVFAYTEAG